MLFILVALILLFGVGVVIINYDFTETFTELANGPENKFINFQDKLSRILSLLN